MAGENVSWWEIVALFLSGVTGATGFLLALVGGSSGVMLLGGSITLFSWTWFGIVLHIIMEDWE